MMNFATKEQFTKKRELAVSMQSIPAARTDASSDYIPVESAKAMLLKGMEMQTASAPLARGARQSSAARGRLNDTQKSALMQQVQLGTPTRPSRLDLNAQIACLRYGYMPSAEEIARVVSQGGARAWLAAQMRRGAPRDFGGNYETAAARIRFFIGLAHQPGGLNATRRALLTDAYREDARRFNREKATTQMPFLMRWNLFWANHFAVGFSTAEASDYKLGLQGHSYVMHHVAQHSLGKFGDFLNANARHTAMLMYLNNDINDKANPSQNYARELMELHTVGVNAGYTQTDVEVASRILTGMRWLNSTNAQPNAMGRVGGEYYFHPPTHDSGAKSMPFLNMQIEAYSAQDGDAKITEFLNALARHPMTAIHIATKLVRHFISDDVSEPNARDIISRIAGVFISSDGDLSEVARAMVMHSGSLNVRNFQYPQPDQIMIGMMRAGNLITAQGSPEEDALLDEYVFNHLTILNMPHLQPPDVRGFLPGSQWVGEANLMNIYDHVAMMAPRIASRRRAADFYNSSIGMVVDAASRLSATKNILRFAEAEPVNAVICTVMSQEFLKRG